MPYMNDDIDEFSLVDDEIEEEDSEEEETF
jgi:hypothetical protein